MQAVTFNNALENLASFMDDVNDNHEPLVITREDRKAVVLMSLDDFNAWQETEYLTRSSANAKDLLQAVDDVKARRNIVTRTPIED